MMPRERVVVWCRPPAEMFGGRRSPSGLRLSAEESEESGGPGGLGEALLRCRFVLSGAPCCHQRGSLVVSLYFSWYLDSCGDVDGPGVPV